MIAAMINHLWQSTLFCGGVWLITLTLRNNGAALRHALWLLASLKFLVPFSLLYVLGSSIGMPAARIADDQPLLLGNTLQSASLLVAPTSALRAATEPDTVSAMLIALLAIWLCGAVLVAARWVREWRTANSIVRAARPAPGTPSDARVTDADIEPAVARIFRPVVLLPAALLGRLSAPQMEAVVAHEHQHISRHDNLTAGAHGLVEVILWFHPAVWWIGRQLLEERERACDEAVLDHGHDREDYAAGILEVCRHCCASARAPAPLSAISGDLTHRIRWILGSTRPVSPGFFKTIALLLFAVAVAMSPLLAGAESDATRRRELLDTNSRALVSADVSIGPAAGGAAAPGSVQVAHNVLLIRNSSLRELIALAYGVAPWQIEGAGDWLDASRYDIRAVADAPVSEPDDLDPYALRGLVTKLLASQFDLKIHVNRRCQAPCGRYALTAADRDR
jgi:bla regulator protein BlaR1